MRIQKALFFNLALSLGIVCLSHSSFAATRVYTSAVDGNFSNAALWGGTAPGASDVAAFTGSPAYSSGASFTVSLTAAVTNQYMRVDGDGPFAMTLNLKGYNYTATDSGGSTTTTTVVGRGSNDNNTLHITGTGIFSANGIYIGAVATSVGKVTVSGTGTKLTTHTNEAVVGFGGEGSLEISNGAEFSSSSLVRAGRSSGSVGSILVSGGTMSTTAEVIIASNASGSKGNLEVQNGGRVTLSGAGSAGQISFAQVSGAEATGLITGLNSQLSANGAIAIGGRGTGAGGTAVVTVADGASMSTASTLRIFAGGELKVDDALVSANDLGATGSEIKGKITLTLSDTDALIDVAEDIYLDGSTSVLTLSLGLGTSYANNDVIRLINYGDTLTGTFSNFIEGQNYTIGGEQFKFSYLMGTSGDKFIGLTAIPEPTVSLLLGTSLAAFGFLNRRKN